MKPEHDIYFQKALQEGYLARSAYKLLQIDEVFNIFNGVTRAIDLCSAPGSWTQVIYNKLHNVLNNYDPSKQNPNVKIVSVDMMPMHRFPGVVHLKADISQYSTMKAILGEFDNVKADVVVCDGAIDVVGMKEIDYFMHHRIFLAALYITLNTLKVGGSFVMKIFINNGHEKILRKLSLFFRNLTVVKPHCSRNKEAFAVCQNYIPLPDFDPVELTTYVELRNADYSNLTGLYRKLIPYLCGDCYKNEFIPRGSLDVPSGENDFYDVLNTILKDSEGDIAILKDRLLGEFPVYQITQDGRLEYDAEFSKVLFQGFEIGAPSQDVADKIDLKNMVIECKNHDQLSDLPDEFFTEDSIISNDKDLGIFVNFNCEKTERQRARIGSALQDKIKQLECVNKGKFSGLGFNVDDWRFFAQGFSAEDVDSSRSEDIKQTHGEFQDIYRKLRESEGVKCRSIKELVVGCEEVKCKVRERFVEYKDDS